MAATIAPMSASRTAPDRLTSPQSPHIVPRLSSGDRLGEGNLCGPQQFPDLQRRIDTERVQMAPYYVMARQEDDSFSSLASLGECASVEEAVRRFNEGLAKTHRLACSACFAQTKRARRTMPCWRIARARLFSCGWRACPIRGRGHAAQPHPLARAAPETA